MDGAAQEFYRRLIEDRQIATTRCEQCDTTHFPPRPTCPRCGEPTIWIELPRHGHLYAFTTQETAVRFAAPAVLVLVQLSEVRLPAVSSTPYDELAIGQEVSVDLIDEPETGLTLLSV
jgi:uncharacterized OB-fold protein